MNIGQGDLKNWPIPLPSLHEQRRIVAILDRAHTLYVKRKQVLARLDDLTQSIFHGTVRAVQGKALLGDIADVRGGKRLPKGSAYAGGRTDFPYIRVVDLQNGRVVEDGLRYLTPEVQALLSRYTVDGGDIIISIAGSVGQIALVPPGLHGANLTENAAKIVAKSPESYDSNWLAHCLRSVELQGQIKGRVGQVTIGKLALFRIEELEVSLPPLSVQEGFSRRASAVDRLRSEVEAGVAGDAELFASLQSRAFGGEL